MVERAPRWSSMVRKSQTLPDPEPPIPLGNRSNGEYFHTQTDHERKIRELALRRADELAPRMGMDRRAFMASTVGVTTSLWAINMVACGDDGGSAGSTGSSSTSGGTGGSTGASTGVASGTTNGYDVGDGTETDGMACEPLDGEFIFDIQTHHVNPEGPWRDTNPGYVGFFEGLEQGACGLEPLACFSADHYIQLMFLDSDTSVAVLSGVPAAACESGVMPCGNPLPNDEIVQTRELVNALAQSQRSVNHAMITPNVDLPAQLDAMQALVEELGVGGWKCYPPWGPTGTGWWLDDPETGIPFIERGLELGVDVFCVHKGLPLPGFDATHTDPRDIGVVAKMFPEAKFVVYHSAWLHGGFGSGEGPYDPDGTIDPQNPVTYPVDQGVNSLIKALHDNEIGPGSNVYAELGSVWTNLMQAPDQAAHVLGKLLTHVGPDNVLWGTDCIWTGSPQPLIEAFRAFQIAQPFQETYGYPALSDDIKRKVFGLNAAAVFGIDPDAMRCRILEGDFARARQTLAAEIGGRRWAARPAAGPRTRREFIRLAQYTRGPG